MADLKHIAIFMSSLSGGGAERAMLSLASSMSERGHQIDLVVCRAEGAFRNHLPAHLKLVVLKPESSLRARLRVLHADPRGLNSLLLPLLFPIKISTKVHYLRDLVRYMRDERPDILLSGMTSPNLVALWARRLAGTPTRVVVIEHNTLSQKVGDPHNKRKWRRRFLSLLVHRTYPWADAITAVSDGVANDLSAVADIPRDRIRTLYNPVVPTDIEEKTQAVPDHTWFTQPTKPVILGVGRFTNVKDFPTLLRAFAHVRKTREARLVILGEGDTNMRGQLEKLAQKLAIGEDVSFPGWVANPYAYMARAAVFVLSSLYEGLPSVLIEAMACGCPVVSTDCPSGPAEILAHGKYGSLVPVGDSEGMAKAIIAVLDGPCDRGRMKARAAEFSLERSTQRYLDLFYGLPQNQ